MSSKPSTPSVVEVVSLHFYPVKSCRGVDLLEAPITSSGLPHDREWMWVDERGRFVTQRTCPQLATLVPSLTADALLLRCPSAPELRVPLTVSRFERPVEIWDEPARAFDAGDEVAAWLNAAIGMNLRLVRADPSSGRRANEKYAQSVVAPLRFPDAFPILLISQESLDELNVRLARPLAMNRFRPNIVVRGAGAHVEDRLGEFSRGPLVLRAVKACTRCRTTCTDQISGEVGEDGEPLRTLMKYRWDKDLRGATFGQNCVIAAGAGAVLRVGDRLTVG